MSTKFFDLQGLISDAVLFLANPATLRNPTTLTFTFPPASTLSFSSSGRLGILDALHNLDSSDRSFDRWFRD